jgi:predicted AlkP superfamily phosphohydrolase/phosphomutase
MYVVEPTGWRAVDEPGVRDGLFEHLVDVEEQHLRSTLKLLEAVDDWRLLAHIITLPDRVSHAFWSFHEPDAYPERSAEELAASRSKVIDAYRESDRLLGELLKHLDRNTTVLIASDHGTAAHNPPYGGHRPEGIFVASGPGVDVGRERLTMSILDVTPVALALLGLPTGEDLPGSPPENLLASTEGLDTITTYEVGGVQRKPAKKTIDETTREQLRGLGYVE